MGSLIKIWKTMPMIGQFESAEEYYSAMFHECGHSTGHRTRLDRFPGNPGYFFYVFCGIVSRLQDSCVFHPFNLLL